MAQPTTTTLTGVNTGGQSAGGGVPKLIEGAKLAFVMALRHMFASDLTNENLRYNSNKDLSKIRIYTAQPLTVEFYPCIIVSMASGDCSFKYLQNDLMNESISGALTNYNGQLWFNMSITVMTNSTVDRERILDHLIFYLRHVYVGAIRGFGIVHGREMRIGSENIMEVENKPVYDQTLDVPCYLEYNAVVNSDLLQTLRAISTTVTVNAGDIE